jgi:hypothetical protein
MVRAILAAVVAMVMALPVLADEDQIEADYQAYHAAMENSELRTALDFERRAHDGAISIYEYGSLEMNSYVAAYGRALNDTLYFETAWRVLEPAVRPARTSEDDGAEISFEVFFEAGRAARGRESYKDSRELTELALKVAETLHGADSTQAAYAHLELARVRPNHSDYQSGNDQHYRAIGSLYGYRRGSQNEW